MRTPLARLVGLAAAGSLILSPLAIAGPASAIEPGNGIISVKLVDDLGQPVIGSVALIPSGEDSAPVTLGQSESGGPTLGASSFTEEIEAGIYGAMAIGGWAGATCVGLSDCTLAGMVGELPTVGAGAFVISAGAPTQLTITIATPKLTGTPGIGQPLVVSVPSSLSSLGSVIGGGFPGALGLSSDPVVAWNRNGAPMGVTGARYTPTNADAGSTISATVTYPPILALMLGMMAPGIAPAPFTTASVSINKLTPSIELSVPGKVKQGKRPTAYVNVSVGQTLVAGVVTFTIDKLRPQQGLLRSGLATFKLPKLKPGKHKVTASFAAAGAYNAAASTKTIVVKADKHKKKNKNKKKKNKKK